MDGFGARHSVGSASYKGQVVMFGGQDVSAEKCLNDVYTYDEKKNELKQIDYLKDGQVVPQPRNSHSTAQNEKFAYIYGGANEEGPLNDCFAFDLTEFGFK